MDTKKYCVVLSTFAGFVDMSGLARWPLRESRAICPLGYKPVDSGVEYDSVPEPDFSGAVQAARVRAESTEQDMEFARRIESIPYVGVQETKLRAVPE